MMKDLNHSLPLMLSHFLPSIFHFLGGRCPHPQIHSGGRGTVTYNHGSSGQFHYRHIYGHMIVKIWVFLGQGIHFWPQNQHPSTLTGALLATSSVLGSTCTNFTCYISNNRFFGTRNSFLALELTSEHSDRRATSY